jgi:hypothetical protein
MTTMDLLILLGGTLFLVVVSALLVGWRQSAVQDVVRQDSSADLGRLADPVDGRMLAVRGKLLWLLVQRGSQSPPPGLDSVAPQVISEARSLLARRRKIEAIRLVRERTGWGLKESKDFVDGLH